MNFLLIGKPNAGKSSIYNILTSGKKNIIHKKEGTTRDWHKSNIKGFSNIIIYDTPGVIVTNNKVNNIQFSELFSKIDKFIYVIDFKIKNYEHEIESINELRKFNKEIILVINKDDNLENNKNFKSFGLKNSFNISCSHNLGFDNLYTFFEIHDNFKETTIENNFSIAIFGKPNAGKSTRANSLLGFERFQTSEVAGTTSDFVAVLIIFNKMDIINNKNLFMKEIKLLVKQTYSQTKNISIIFLSAKNIMNVDKLKDTIFTKSKKILQKLPTGKLNTCIKNLSKDKPHPLVKGRVVNFKYAVQVSTSPLTIKIFSNFPKAIKSNYKTYLINMIIKNFNIVDTKVRLIFTSSKNPFN